MNTRTAMLEAILEAVPAQIAQKEAASIAMAYNDVDSLGPPPSLLRLRIALRKPGAGATIGAQSGAGPGPGRGRHGPCR